MAAPRNRPVADIGGRRFDSQAEVFDDRTGLPPDKAEEIADAVVGFASEQAISAVLELGAGTGELGRCLGRLGHRYVGLDLSRPMLEVFASKRNDGRAGDDGAGLLVHADADADWPVRDGAVSVIFASRAAHLLAPGHAVDEVLRVCARPGGFVVGRVERTGIKRSLRRQREAMLIARGVAAGRSGLRRTEALLESFADRGAVALPRRTVASWTSAVSAEEVISAWEPMSTMAGQPVAPDTKAEVLNELRRWALEEFGDLDRPHPYDEHYTLEGVRLG